MKAKDANKVAKDNQSKLLTHMHKLINAEAKIGRKTLYVDEHLIDPATKTALEKEGYIVKIRSGQKFQVSW